MPQILHRKATLAVHRQKTQRRPYVRPEPASPPFYDEKYYSSDSTVTTTDTRTTTSWFSGIAGVFSNGHHDSSSVSSSSSQSTVGTSLSLASAPRSYGLARPVEGNGYSQAQPTFGATSAPTSAASYLSPLVRRLTPTIWRSKAAAGSSPVHPEDSCWGHFIDTADAEQEALRNSKFLTQGYLRY
jgi:hypothetical protein